MSWDGCSTHKERTASVGIYRQKLRGYMSSVMSLISHPHGDLSAAYLGTTILYFHNLLAAYLGTTILRFYNLLAAYLSTIILYFYNILAAYLGTTIL